MAAFFTSDHHFGDGRRLGFDHRPFPTVEAMDRAMVESWNEVVGPHDTVWHLGDFARTVESAADMLGRLNGAKHLVVGNADPQGVRDLSGWASVQTYVELAEDGHLLVLCHYPFRTWNGMGRGALNLHGHSHGRLRPAPRQFDVGVDVHGFRPVPLSELVGKAPAAGRAR